MSYSKGREFLPDTEGGRRKFLKYTGAGAKTFLTGVFADAGINTGILAENRELGNMGVKEDHLSPDAIRDIYYGNDVSVELYVLGDDSIGNESYGPEGELLDEPWSLEKAGKVLESKLNQLGEGDFKVSFTSTEIDDYLEEEIGDVTVKGFKHGVVDEAREYLKEEDLYNPEADLHAYIGDFDADLKDYKGSTVEKGEAAAANVYSPEYVLNQIIHNVGHLLGLGHASVTSRHDSMTGHGVLRHARFRDTVVGYSRESKESFKDNAQDILHQDRPVNSKPYPR